MKHKTVGISIVLATLMMCSCANNTTPSNSETITTSKFTVLTSHINYTTGSTDTETTAEVSATTSLATEASQTTSYNIDDYPLPVEIELPCEWTEEDMEVQEFLAATENELDILINIVLDGIVDRSSEGTDIFRVTKEDTDGYSRTYVLQSEETLFSSIDAMKGWMNKYFSEAMCSQYFEILFDGYYSEATEYYVEPRFIEENGRLYRHESTAPRYYAMDFDTAKVIESDDDSIIFACLGTEQFRTGYTCGYIACYGALKREDGVLKYDWFPQARLYSYNGSDYGDVTTIWGIQG